MPTMRAPRRGITAITTPGMSVAAQTQPGCLISGQAPASTSAMTASRLSRRMVQRQVRVAGESDVHVDQRQRHEQVCAEKGEQRGDTLAPKRAIDGGDERGKN